MNKDFSWTPDRGIKFAPPSHAAQTPAISSPVFNFTNPLAAKNPTPEKPSPGFGFGSATRNTQRAGFSFGLGSEPSSDDNGRDEPTDISRRQEANGNKETELARSGNITKSPAFSFGSASGTSLFRPQATTSTPSFNFLAPKATADSDSTKNSEGAAGSGHDDTDGDHMPSEPRTNDALIAGPAEGEENDEVLHTARAKVYKWEADQEKPSFTDLGVCLIKVNRSKGTGSCRLLARTEGIGKLLLNFWLQPVTYKVEGKRNIKMPVLTDGRWETYLLKLREPEGAEALAKVLAENKAV